MNGSVGLVFAQLHYYSLGDRVCQISRAISPPDQVEENCGQTYIDRSRHNWSEWGCSS